MYLYLKLPTDLKCMHRSCMYNATKKAQCYRMPQQFFKNRLAKTSENNNRKNGAQCSLSLNAFAQCHITNLTGRKKYIIKPEAEISEVSLARYKMYMLV